MDSVSKVNANQGENGDAYLPDPMYALGLDSNSFLMLQVIFSYTAVVTSEVSKIVQNHVRSVFKISELHTNVN